MKKLFSVMLVLAMLCGMLMLPASAAGSGSLSMSSATGNRGDTASVKGNQSLEDVFLDLIEESEAGI